MRYHQNTRQNGAIRGMRSATTARKLIAAANARGHHPAFMATVVTITKTTEAVVSLVASRGPLNVAGIIVPEGAVYFLVQSKFPGLYYCVAFLDGEWKFSGDPRIKQQYVRKVQCCGTIAA